MIRFTSISRTASKSWLFTWDDTGGPYRVVLFGLEIARTDSPQYVFSSMGTYMDYPPPIEVVKDGELAVTEEYPPDLVVQWYRVPGASSYRVEEYVGGQWVFAANVVQNRNTVFTHQTGPREDQTDIDIRVAAVNELEDIGAYQQYHKFNVTAPAPASPDVSVGYDSLQIQFTEA
jgi:hypothetical protein